MTANELLMQMGWSGILAAALCFLFRQYARAQEQVVHAQQDRIAALEKHCDRLEEQLRACNERIWDLLQERLAGDGDDTTQIPLAAASPGKRQGTPSS